MVSSDNMLVGNEYYKPEVSSLGGFPGSEFRIEIGSPGGGVIWERRWETWGVITGRFTCIRRCI